MSSRCPEQPPAVPRPQAMGGEALWLDPGALALFSLISRLGGRRGVYWQILGLGSPKSPVASKPTHSEGGGASFSPNDPGSSSRPRVLEALWGAGAGGAPCALAVFPGYRNILP